MGRLTLEQNPQFSRGLEAGVKPSPTTTPEHKKILSVVFDVLE